MISPNDEKTLREATLYLENIDSGIMFVEVNEPARQDEIATSLKERLTLKETIVIDLKGLSPDTTHLDEVKKRLQTEPNSEVVLILNLHTLAKNVEGKEPGLVRDLNFSREPYARMNKLLVFFFPSYFIDLIAQHARDFFDFVSMSFKFLPDRTGAFEGLDPLREMAEEKFLRNRVAFLESALESYTFTESERADKLFDLAEGYSKLYLYDKALSFYFKCLELSRIINNRKIEGVALNNISQIYQARGDYETALKYLQDSLKIRREIGDKSGEGTVLNNISQIYDARGDYETALKYLQDSLKIRREIGDKSGEGAALNNISQIYRARGDYETALKYLQDSLKIRREIGDKSGEGAVLNNISQIYDARGDYETALKYLQDSLKICREIGHKSGEGAVLNNISGIYQARGNYETALKYLQDSLKITIEIGAKSGQIPTLHNMALIEYEMKNMEKTLALETEAYKIALETGDALGLFQVGQFLGQILIENGQRKEGITILRRSYEIGRASGMPGAEDIKNVLQKLGEEI